MRSPQSRSLRPPRYQTSFVGRRRELRTLKDALAPGAIVSLVGPGGVGKTRLASEAVYGLRACFLDLTRARDPSDAAQVVLQALGSRQRPPPEQDPVEHAAVALAGVQAEVVVLDNLEQLEEAADFVERLRTEGPQRSWLLTSRLPLGLGEERQIPVTPFEVEGEAREAVDLFLRVLSPTAPPTLHAQRERLARLVAALDGLPLAIELAAARASVLSLDEIEARLADPLRLLADPSRPEDKGSTLWRSVSWSVELLPAEARRALARCSVFAGWFDEESARAVGGPGARAHLQRLLQLHLLREEGGRYRPYEVVARFAELLLEASGERDDAVLAHARWCWERSEPIGHGERMWETYALLGPELDLAQRRAEQPGADPLLLEIGQRLAVRWHLVQEVRRPRLEYIERAERMVPRLDNRLAALISLRRASALQSLGRLDEGEALLQQIVAFAREQGLAQILVIGLSHLADGAVCREQFERAEGLLREALEVARSAGLRELELEILRGPIHLPLVHQGRYAEILENFGRVRALGGDQPWIALGIYEALVYLELGEWERVQELVQRLPEPSRMSPIHQSQRRFILCKLALVQQARPSEHVTSLRQDLPSLLELEMFETLGLVADLLDGRAAPEALERAVQAAPFGGRRGDSVRRMLLEIAGVALGIAPAALVDRRDPVMTALSDALALLREHMQGRLEVQQAQERLQAVRPPSWELHFARRVLADRAQWLRQAIVGPEGASFELGGVRVSLEQPVGRRLLRALAEDAQSGGKGLSVEALFAAGWPGEALPRAASANRVRVALTKLRQAGVPVRFVRGQGWSLDVPGVRYGSMSTATDRAPSK